MQTMRKIIFNINWFIYIPFMHQCVLIVYCQFYKVIVFYIPLVQCLLTLLYTTSLLCLNQLRECLFAFLQLSESVWRLFTVCTVLSRNYIYVYTGKGCQIMCGVIIVISGKLRGEWHEYSVTVSGVQLMMWVYSVCIVGQRKCVITVMCVFVCVWLGCQCCKDQTHSFEQIIIMVVFVLPLNVCY